MSHPCLHLCTIGTAEEFAGLSSQSYPVPTLTPCSHCMATKVDVEVTVPAESQSRAQGLRVGGTVHLARRGDGGVTCSADPPPSAPAHSPAEASPASQQRPSDDAATQQQSAPATSTSAAGAHDAGATAFGTISLDISATLPSGAAIGTVRSIRRAHGDRKGSHRTPPRMLCVGTQSTAAGRHSTPDIARASMTSSSTTTAPITGTASRGHICRRQRSTHLSQALRTAARPPVGHEPLAAHCRRAAGSQTVTHVTVRVVAPAHSGTAAQGVPPLAPALFSSGPPDEEEMQSMRLPRQKLELLGTPTRRDMACGSTESPHLRPERSEISLCTALRKIQDHWISAVCAKDIRNAGLHPTRLALCASFPAQRSLLLRTAGACRDFSSRCGKPVMTSAELHAGSGSCCRPAHTSWLLMPGRTRDTS